MMNEGLYPHMYITFRYGQLSGLVEPIAGLLGAALVAIIVPILPYALAFAAVENIAFGTFPTSSTNWPHAGCHGVCSGG